MDWIHLTQHGVKWQSVVNICNETSHTITSREFYDCAAVSSSRRALLNIIIYQWLYSVCDIPDHI